jgi:hypothetical protein
LRRVRIPDAVEPTEMIEVSGHQIPRPPAPPTETVASAVSASSAPARVATKEYAYSLDECD